MQKKAPTTESAIEAALNQNWKEAIRINNSILEHNPHDIDALNRLGFAQLKMCQFASAKRTFQKILDTDAYNQIALKNLKKLSTLRKKSVRNTGSIQISAHAFLAEPGKTKIIECINVAPIHILSSLSPGQEVCLKAKNHVVEVRNDEGVYLGALPDDISFKLIKLMTAGNTYQAIMKGVAKNILIVVIREMSRGKRFANQPSFLTTATYIPFVRKLTPDDIPNITATGESDEATEDS